MYLYVLPVSGGLFPFQLAELSALMKYSAPRPDVIFASSGGNVCSWLALSSDWNSERLLQNASMLKSELFIRSWFPRLINFIPSWVMGVFKNSIYAPGSFDDLCAFFTKMLPKYLLSKTELWIGTTNVSKGRAQFFCNLEEAQCRIRNCNFACNRYVAQPLSYSNLDIPTICRSALASAAIPTFVPEVIIEGEKFMDGGITYASPLSALKCSLKDEEIHLTYLSSFDVEEANKVLSGYEDIFKIGVGSFEETIRIKCCEDRNIAIDMVSKGYEKEISSKGDFNIDTYTTLDKLRDECQRSLIEIFPSFEDDDLLKEGLDYTDFKGDEILKYIQHCESKLKFRFWGQLK